MQKKIILLLKAKSTNYTHDSKINFRVWFIYLDSYCISIYKESIVIKLSSKVIKAVIRKVWRSESNHRVKTNSGSTFCWMKSLSASLVWLCVVMTSSQTLMAHNVPRKIGQQFTFFVFVHGQKFKTPLVVFCSQFWLILICVFTVASWREFILSGEAFCDILNQIQIFYSFMLHNCRLENQAHLYNLCLI